MSKNTDSTGSRNSNIRELIKIYREGNEEESKQAVTQIYNDNASLIGYIIRKRFPSYSEAHYHDLFSSGKIGLLNAINKYNPDKGKPSTFFAFYILHELYRHVVKEFMMVSPYKAKIVQEVSYAMQRLEDRGITEPDSEQVANEIAAYTGNEKPDLAAVADAMAARAAAQTKDYESDDYLDSLMTDFGENPEHIYEAKERSMILYSEFERLLTPQEKFVLTRLYGLDESQGCSSYAAIAKEAGIQPNTVKKINQQAIRKLRKSRLSGLYQDMGKDISRSSRQINVTFKPSTRELLLQDERILSDRMVEHHIHL